MSGEQLTFVNGGNTRLAAFLHRPAGIPKAYALFAHCFEYGKDSPAARIIAETLVAHGIAVLRFDFTGLGDSESAFAQADFSADGDNLVAAADHLRLTAEAPALLIGHSLAGAAMLAVASRIPEARAVATIGAPCDPSHLTGLLADRSEATVASGTPAVSIDNRSFTVKRQLLDDISQRNLTPRIASLRKALLVMHAPTDRVVAVENAATIFVHSKHPKSFVALDGADHLLTRPADAAFAGEMLAVWGMRYVLDGKHTAREDGAALVFETHAGRFQQSLALGRHSLLADEPVSSGGLDSGPSPYDFLLGGLGACTAMTIRLYADRKQIPLDHVAVELNHSRLHAEDGQATCDERHAALERIDRKIMLEGNLDAGQRAKLMEIADKCPVHRTLTSHLEIRTTEYADPDPDADSLTPRPIRFRPGRM